MHRSLHIILYVRFPLWTTLNDTPGKNTAPIFPTCTLFVPFLFQVDKPDDEREVSVDEGTRLAMVG